MLGLGNNLSKGGLASPGIVTSNLVLKHKYDAGAVVPVSDGAAYFDTTDDYIAVTETTLSVHDTAYSFSFWVNLTDVGSWQPIFGDDDAFYNFIAIDQENDRLVIEGSSDGDNMQWNTLNSGTALTLRQWYHFAVCLNGSGSATAYQNGVAMQLTDDTIGTDLTFKYIGKGSNYFLGGYLCNVAYWSSQLTQAQVKSIMWKNYAGLSDSEKTNLVSWWNLDSSFSGSVTNDELLVYDNHYNAGTDILGDNVLLDGTFTEDVGESASGTYWTTGAGWTISGGSATYDGGGDSNTQLDSAVNSNIVDGNVYQIKFDLTDTGGGGVFVNLNNTWWSEGGSDVITGTATHTIYARAGTGTNRIEFETGHDDKAFSLDNITIRKVNGNPGVLL